MSNDKSPLTYSEFLATIPKVELHCHFPGTVLAATAVELAAKNGVELPCDDPAELYQYDTIVGFLTALQAVSKTMVTTDDLARVAFEALEQGVRYGNLRYREMFFNPDYHYEQGLTYDEVVSGIGQGIERAANELGVRCNLIAAISRFHGPEAAVAMVQTVIDHPHPRVVGIGMDDLTPEGEEAPGLFADAYALAHAHGLRTTAHVAEIDGASAQNVAIALDVLGVERVDHGYRIMEDPALVERAQRTQVHFTTCPGSSSWLYGFTYSDHPIRAMFDAGLHISFNTDDPPFFGTALDREYVLGAAEMGFTAEEVTQVCLNAADACWLPDVEKAALREEIRSEIATLAARLA